MRRTWLVVVGLIAGCSDDPLSHSHDAAVEIAVAIDASEVAVDATPDDAPATCDDARATVVPEETARALGERRRGCAFAAGARVSETLGLTPELRARVPIDHVVVVVQENRSFDHYLGALGGEVDGIPGGYTNPDAAGHPVRPEHLDTTCVPADPPHQWASMHAGWNDGHMDGFLRSGTTPPTTCPSTTGSTPPSP